MERVRSNNEKESEGQNGRSDGAETRASGDTVLTIEAQDDRVNFVTTIKCLFILLVLISWYALEFGPGATSLKGEVVETKANLKRDLEINDAAHLIDSVPRCLTDCIFPLALSQNCGHMDYSCTCAILRFLPPPPPPKRPLNLAIDGKRRNRSHALNETRSHRYQNIAEIKLELNREIAMNKRLGANKLGDAASKIKRKDPGVDSTERIEDLHHSNKSATTDLSAHQFRACIKQYCTTQDEVRGPLLIENLCDAFGVSLDFEEVLSGQQRFLNRRGLFRRATASGSGLLSGVAQSTPFSQRILQSASPTITNKPLASPTNPANTFNSSTSTRGSSFPTTFGSGNGNTSSGGLSSGAKIGVGVSIPLVAIMLGIAGFSCFIRRSKGRGASGIPGQNDDGSRLPEVAASPHSPPPYVSRTSLSLHASPLAAAPPESVSKASNVPVPWERSGENDSMISDPNRAEPTAPVHATSSSAPQASQGGTRADDDDEVQMLEQEMAQVRQRRERLREVQELDLREEELRRRIAERKKAAGTGGTESLS